MNLIKFRPPRIAMTLLLVAAAATWLTPLGDGPRAPFPITGLLLAFMGFAVMMWGWWLFRETGVAVCPTAPTARLVTRSVYRATRNAMYLGMIAMLTGIAAVVGTIPFYVAALAYFLIINFAFCPFEEAKLEAQFGNEYLAYKARVGRWLTFRAARHRQPVQTGGHRLDAR